MSSWFVGAYWMISMPHSASIAKWGQASCSDPFFDPIISYVWNNRKRVDALHWKPWRIRHAGTPHIVQTGLRVSPPRSLLHLCHRFDDLSWEIFFGPYSPWGRENRTRRGLHFWVWSNLKTGRHLTLEIIDPNLFLLLYIWTTQQWLTW